MLVFVAEGKPPDKLLPDQWALANPDKVLQVVTMITARPKSGKTKNEWPVGPPPPEMVIWDWFV